MFSPKRNVIINMNLSLKLRNPDPSGTKRRSEITSWMTDHWDKKIKNLPAGLSDQPTFLHCKASDWSSSRNSLFLVISYFLVWNLLYIFSSQFCYFFNKIEYLSKQGERVQHLRNTVEFEQLANNIYAATVLEGDTWRMQDCYRRGERPTTSPRRRRWPDYLSVY